MTNIVNEANRIIKEVTPIIEKQYNTKLPNITVSASGHMRKTFGLAIYREGKFYIKLSKYAYENKTDTKAFRNTVIHELAHVAERVIFYRFSHSADWAGIMRVCGENASRFVTTEKKDEIGYVRPPKRTMTKYVHKCAGGCSHTLSGQKHNKLLRGTVYTCRKTGGRVLTSFTTIKV